jgi:hypothetical protein
MQPMNREQAIQLLTQQLNRINVNFDPIHWTEITQGIINRIFPRTAQEKRDQLDDISYSANTPHSFREFEEAAMERGKERARQYLTSVDKAIDLVIKRTGKTKVYLAVHSWGGSVAALYASEFPHKVAKLVLFAAITQRLHPYTNAEFCQQVHL